MEPIEYIITFTGTYKVTATSEEAARALWCDADFGEGEDLDITDISPNC